MLTEPLPPPVGGAHGVQAAETLLTVLSAFIDAEPATSLKALAIRAGMPPAKAHRYLASLCRMRFVEQDPQTSHYRLGPEALRLAFASMGSSDSVSVARPVLGEICRKLQHSVILAVWQTGGPMVALKENSPALFGVTAPEGTVLPLLRSSIGRAFAAWLPRTRTQARLDAELAQMRAAPIPGCPASAEEVETLLSDIRGRGLARVTGQLSPSSHSLAAPVFGASGEIVAVLAAIGPAGDFDSRWTGPTAQSLRASASTLSHRLGHWEHRALVGADRLSDALASQAGTLR